MKETARSAILIADDEPAVGLIATRILEMNGYAVVNRVNGQEVADLFAPHDPGFALVLIDLSMPAPAGSELIACIRQTAPEVPIVLMSGFDRQSATARAAGAADFLQKPFRGPELLAIVSRYVPAAPAG